MELTEKHCQNVWFVDQCHAFDELLGLSMRLGSEGDTVAANLSSTKIAASDTAVVTLSATLLPRMEQAKKA